MRVADCNQVRISLRKLTASDAVVRLDELLWERGVLKRPETQVTTLKLVVLLNADIVLTVTSGDKIRVSFVDIDTCDLATLSKIALESEQMLEDDFPFLELLFDLFLFFLLFLLLCLLVAEETKALLALFLVVVLAVRQRTLVHGGVVLVLHVLLVELRLGKQTLNNADGHQHRVRQLFVHELDLLDLCEIAGCCLRAKLLSTGLAD
jgi:hypothetical protein